jgi:chromate transport protein ChrA
MTQEPHGTYLDVGAITIWIASLANILPSIAALLSIIWLLIRIWESDTVGKLVGRKGVNHGSTED